MVVRQCRLSTRVVVATVSIALVGGCVDLFPPSSTTPSVEDGSAMRITLVNDSETLYVAPMLGICPNGMAAQPHEFVDTAPMIEPGGEITYTSVEIAGNTNGDCSVFTTDFMIGLCGWQYGPAEDDLTAANTPYGGRIGESFSCGDTVILHFTDAGDGTGAWVSEVVPAEGNPELTTPFALQ